jgi:hypothetical protein
MINKIETAAVFTLLFCGIVFIMTIIDFAALHDIKQDYVSQSILHDLDINLSGELPWWTSTKGEWGVVSLSLIFRFVFLIINFAVLFQYIKKDHFKIRSS